MKKVPYGKYTKELRLEAVKLVVVTDAVYGIYFPNISF